MDPRFNVYVTFIPDDSDSEDGSAGHGRDEPRTTEASRDPGVKNAAALPIKAGKARRRSGGTNGIRTGNAGK